MMAFLILLTVSLIAAVSFISFGVQVKDKPGPVGFQNETAASPVRDRGELTAAEGLRSVQAMPSLLIVDDQKALRNMLAEWFSSLGWDVAEAADGQAALHYAEQKRLDYILLDLSMPGMNGLETLKRLHGQGTRAGVVLMTAFAEPEQIGCARQLGVLHIVQKPFDVKELHSLFMSEQEKKML
ncbi:response regulator [Paenibacillus protaetiae]|nr:response regulator [Paenibacillus protaetiae]